MEKIKDLISVIVPIYNAAEYLDKCISSICEQTYKHIEVLLIDDGSKDNSEEICKKWTNNDNRISFYKKENGGVSSARNFGLDKAKGKWIAFVDADDFILPNMYQRLWEMAETEQCELAICSRIRILANGTKEMYPDMGYHVFYKGIVNMNLLACQYDLNISVNKLYHYSLFEDVRFPQNMTYAEDLFIVPDLISKTRKIAYTSEGLYCYIEHTESASFTLTDSKLRNDIEAKTKFYNYLYAKQAPTNIAFNWLFGAYVRGYKQATQPTKKEIKHEYNSFFLKHIFKCILKLKYTIFLVMPKLYFKLK